MKYQPYEKLTDEDIFFMLLIVIKGAYPSKLTNTFDKIFIIERIKDFKGIIDFCKNHMFVIFDWPLLNEAKDRFKC